MLRTPSFRLTPTHLVLSILLSIAFGPRFVRACSQLGAPEPMTLLGIDDYAPQQGAEPLVVTIPRNAAGLAGRGESFTSGGATFERVAEDLTSVGHHRLVRSDHDDLTAPQLTVRGAVRRRWEDGRGCVESTCDGMTWIEFDVSATDDVAPTERITYGIWLARDARDLRAALDGPPDVWRMVADDGRVWTYVANDAESEFFAIRAFDQAGNASAPSEAMRVED